MSALLSPMQSQLARRLGMLCAVTLAMFTCSAFGLLLFAVSGDEPQWLWIVVIGSGSVSLTSFLTWLLLNLAALMRGDPHPR